jgi:hypothetical protein
VAGFDIGAVVEVVTEEVLERQGLVVGLVEPGGDLAGLVGGDADSARKADTIRFGGVPISVVMPPRMVPNDRGIRIRPGGRSSREATRIATGMSSASAPTLFMKPDITAPSTVSATIVSTGPALAGSRLRAARSMAPDDSRPRLSTSTQATVITAGCPKPSNASTGGTSPASTQASSAPTATMS